MRRAGSRPRPSRWGPAAAAAAVVAALVDPAGLSATEYIAAENTAPARLEDVVVPSDGILEGPAPPGVRDHPLSRIFFEAWRRKAREPDVPFFRDAVYHFNERAYYRWKDNGEGTDASEALAFGGSLGVVSGWIGEAGPRLRFGTTGFASVPVAGPQGSDGAGLVRSGKEGYTALGEAFAEAQWGPVFATGFRKALDLPFINRNDSRMTPNTFEHYGIKVTPFEGLDFGGGHVARIKTRLSGGFDPLSEVAGAPGTDRGVSVAALRWAGDERFTFAAAGELGWDTFNTIYADIDSLWRLPRDTTLRFGLQFADQRSVGDELVGSFDAQFGGAKVSVGRGSLIGHLAFTATSRRASVRNPWGGHPSYNSLMISDFDRPGEKSVVAGLSWNGADAGLPALSGFANLAHGFGAVGAPDQTELDVTVDLKVAEGYFGGLWLRARTGWNWRDDGNDQTDVRLIVNYGFEF